MRRIGLLLVVSAALIIALQHHGQGGSLVPRKVSVSGRLERVSRALTLLDVWSQLLVSNLLLQQAQAHAQRVGDVASATLLAGRVRRGLLQVEGFAVAAAKDGALGNRNSFDGRAVRVAATAWRDWASALLRRPGFLIGDHGRHIAELESRAMRLDDAAYAAVDASFRAAVETR